MSEFCKNERHGGICVKTGTYCNLGACPYEQLEQFAPVVHGRWEYDHPTINTYGQLRCSICDWWTLDPSVEHSYSYCPNCGAKMDGGTVDV